MKSHLLQVLRLVHALSDDIAVNHPTYRLYAYRYLMEYEKGLRHQDLAYATITLPECGKWFEACLEQGSIHESRPYGHGRWRKTVYPHFFTELWVSIFDDQGIIRHDADPYSILALRQIYYLLKKLKMECEDARTYASTDSFESIENRMVRSWPDTWDSDHPIWRPRSGHPIYGDLEVARQQLQLSFLDEEESRPSIPWDKFRTLCGAIVTSFGDLDVWSLRPKHGPGVVSDSDPKFIKYDFVHWPRKLENVFPFDWFASHTVESAPTSDWEPSSKLISVPKTQKSPRLIAAEPTAHQWIQGGLQRWLEEVISRSAIADSIDFRNQAKSQEKARHASYTREHATVDLSEASDRLSTRLVEFVLQTHRPLLDALHASRTRSCYIPADLRLAGVSKLVQLRKFATMGSAVIFPIQTLVYTCISQFALMCADDDWDMTRRAIARRAKEIQVFGDDIIIATRAYGLLVNILTEVGLKVNTSKSFTQGAFREACGMDAYNGDDVTPAYVRMLYHPRKPESLASVVEASNNFFKKGFWRTADYLRRTVPDRINKLIPFGREPLWPLTYSTFGANPSNEHLARRINGTLHREEALVVTLTARSKKRRGSGFASLFQYFTEDPPPFVIWEAGQASRPSLKQQARWVTTAR